MTPTSNKPPVTEIALTYVLSKGVLYFVDNQRIASAVAGLHAEPALANSVAQVFTVLHDRENIYPGAPLAVAFDADGWVREDIARQSSLASLQGLAPATFVRQWGSEDILVKQFIEVAGKPLDVVALRDLVRSAQLLPGTTQ